MKKIFLGIIGLILMFSISMVSANNLVMTDLEGINLDGLTVTDYSSSIQDDCVVDGEPWVDIIFEIRSYEGVDDQKFPFSLGEGDFTQNYTILGKRYIGKNVITEYYDEEEITEELPVVLRLNTDCIADIREGDYITLTYDGGQTLDVYLPVVNGRVFSNLFIAEDGSTYLDDALTDILAEVPVRKYYDVGDTIDLPYLTPTELSDFDYSDGNAKYVYCAYDFESPDEEQSFGGFVPLSDGYPLCPAEGISVDLAQGTSTWNLAITSIDMTHDDDTGSWIPGEAKILDSLEVEYKTIVEPDADFISMIMELLLNILCEIYPFGVCGF